MNSYRYWNSLLFIVLLFISSSCQEQSFPVKVLEGKQTAETTSTKVQTSDGQFISWKEHLIDDITISGADLSGSDGLEMADLDGDGYEDIVSVHESDTEYDGALEGNIRVAFGTANPDQ